MRSYELVSVLAELSETAKHKKRVCAVKINGKPGIDIRLWLNDGSGIYQPTRAGITLKPKEVSMLFWTIANLVEIADE